MIENWPRTPGEAVDLQETLRHQVRTETPLTRQPRFVAGVDVAYPIAGQTVAGAVAVLDAATLNVVEIATATAPTAFEYVPGLLAFREIPVLLAALAKLSVRPDVFVCDGYGVAHPRRFGLACHFGLLTDTPAFGVAKTSFIGTHGPVGPERGDHTDLVDGGEIVGSVVRTRRNVKPVYVSAGHLIDQAGARDLALRLTREFRLPETTRAADHACRAALKAD
ncbi:deoxyribonuclease V [Hamadaea tsunoensis]|uniref:deoxyribonuclease V n=1 Tax=Hamadaea tsunoensis TaxID=53368 RepID=UPI00040811AB|nr:deoxyribonuclease V [Hamadaea tsunoensis]